MGILWLCCLSHVYGDTKFWAGSMLAQGAMDENSIGCAVSTTCEGLVIEGWKVSPPVIRGFVSFGTAKWIRLGPQLLCYLVMSLF
jgi:hypothetical protein